MPLVERVWQAAEPSLSGGRVTLRVGGRDGLAEEPAARGAEVGR
jgi:hypothetical protein